ncbi:MAG: MMPL family transporter [Propionibacteriaceae bacterium]|nr:MMPL family transporter [Propionibacteriaceae bacterium]
MADSGTRVKQRSTTGVPMWVRVVCLALVGVWLAVAALGGPLLGQLSALQENDSTAFLDAAAESSIASDEAAAFSEGDGLPLFVVLTDEGGIEPEEFGAIATFLSELPDRELGEGRTFADILAEDPEAVIPSEGGDAVMLPISLDADQVREKIDETPVARLAIDQVQAAAESEFADAGYEVAVTGPASYVADFGTAFAGIDGVLLVVALVVVFAILVVVYRSPFLPLAVLLASVFGLAAAGWAVHALASRDLLSISGQSQGILSILVVGAATDYALLVVARYREELTRTASAWQAMRRTWRGTVEPISASAATVIAGLLCLLLSDLESTSSLGPISTLGIVAALLAALTFLPAVLLLFGRRIFWPRIPQLKATEDAADADAEGAVAEGSGVWAKIAAFVGRNARMVWIGATVLLVACAALAGTFKADGLGNTEVFRVEVGSVVGERVLAEHFPAGAATPVTVVVPEDLADEVVTAAEEVDGVASASVTMEAPSGPPPGAASGPPEGAPEGAPTGPPAGVEPTPQVVDGNVLVSISLDAEGQSLAAQDAVEAVRAGVHEVDADLHVGGLAAQALDTRLANERDMVRVLPAIALVVFLVLMVLLRSLVAPVVLMTANILSFLATMGVSAVLFNHVFKFPNSDPSTPIYAFVFLIALGIDYSIFLMTRVREEVPRRGARPAVLYGLSVTGGVITSAGLVLAATFAALVVIPLVFMAQIAFMVAFGVLIDTLIVRALLVSGLSYDLGRAAWWPSRLADRLPRRAAVLESPVEGVRQDGGHDQ